MLRYELRAGASAAREAGESILGLREYGFGVLALALAGMYIDEPGARSASQPQEVESWNCANERDAKLANHRDRRRKQTI